MGADLESSWLETNLSRYRKLHSWKQSLEGRQTELTDLDVGVEERDPEFLTYQLDTWETSFMKWKEGAEQNQDMDSMTV